MVSFSISDHLSQRHILNDFMLCKNAFITHSSAGGGGGGGAIVDGGGYVSVSGDRIKSLSSNWRRIPRNEIEIYLELR